VSEWEGRYDLIQERVGVKNRADRKVDSQVKVAFDLRIKLVLKKYSRHEDIEKAAQMKLSS